MGEYVLAHCYGCEAPSRDLLAAFGVEREPGHAATLPAPAYIPPDPKPFILEPEPRCRRISRLPRQSTTWLTSNRSKAAG